MPKLIILSFDGSLESGFKVIIQAREEQGSPYLQSTGSLPFYPQLATHYCEWSKSYRALGKQVRAIKTKAARIDSSAASLRQECRQLSASLKADIDTWLADPGFNPVRRELYRELASDQECRILIQANDPQLWRLPWHLWEELEQYPTLELGFCKNDYSKFVSLKSPVTPKVNILAIFGDNQGINTEIDEIDLRALSNANVEILRKPSRQEFSDKLWHQSWDILFFAGHSQTSNAIGYIQLNETDSLSIGQLRKSLKQAISRGLQLAIFNSCDGLGLAWELEELNIPQLILMRELVPDIVAQKFLQYFLHDYAGGKTLYTAVRQARDRLESLENDFPCATWLPIICQNPAFSPPTWHDLQSDNAEIPLQSRDFLRRLPTYHQVFYIAALSIGITAAVLGLRFSGALQQLELWSYDVIVRLSPANDEYDPSILIVEVTEDDLYHPTQKDRIDSLSPTALNQLLTILNQAEAAVIGLDIYRDRSFEQGENESLLLKEVKPHLSNPNDISKWANTNSPLITTCRVRDIAASKPEVIPPQNFPLKSVGFSDTMSDQDRVVRRALIAMQPEVGQCVPPYSLNLQLALRYLSEKDIQLQFPTGNSWQLGEATLTSLKTRPGIYLNADVRGLQILLRYRKIPGSSPVNSFETVSLSQVLDGEIAAQSIKNRIVLIGTTAASYRDYHRTPFRYDLPGVVLQAHVTSQIIDAAVGHRPLLWFWPMLADNLWILFWSCNGVILALGLPATKLRLLLRVALFCLLCTVSWGTLIFWNGFLPIVPSLLGLILPSIFSLKVFRTVFRVIQ